MRIELLYFDGCPSYETLLPRLRLLLEREDIDAPVELRRVETLKAAEREGFLGSPTVRIDGEDIDPEAAKRSDFGLKCRLYRNDGGNANSWIAVRTRGVKSNRDGIGAVVRVTSASGKQWSLVRSGSSYASQSDLVQTFGLGKDTVVSAIDVEWPSGAKDHVVNVPGKQIVTIEEGRGLVK